MFSTSATEDVKAFIEVEMGNQEAMEQEARLKGRETPPDATVGTAIDSLNQMPDEILEDIVDVPSEVRRMFSEYAATYGQDFSLDTLYNSL